MFDLNDETIQENGTKGGFDASKIFGFSIVENNTIIKTLDNVTLSEVTIPTADANYCDFIFKDASGNTLNMREYPVDMEREGAEAKAKNQAKRLKHVITKYVPEGTRLPVADNFADLCAGIKQLIGTGGLAAQAVRLKLVYNARGYLSIPKYVRFIEPMSIPSEQTELSLNPGFDSLTRPQAETGASLATPVDAEDDLPF